MMKHIAVPQALLNEQALLAAVNTEGMTEEQLDAHELKVEELADKLSCFGDIEMTAEEEAAFIAGQAMSQADAATSELKANASRLLEKSDITILRCGECNVPVPQAWAEYRAALRLIAKNGEGTIPAEPAYPEGT